MDRPKSWEHQGEGARLVKIPVFVFSESLFLCSVRPVGFPPSWPGVHQTLVLSQKREAVATCVCAKCSCVARERKCGLLASACKKNTHKRARAPVQVRHRSRLVVAVPVLTSLVCPWGLRACAFRAKSCGHLSCGTFRARTADRSLARRRMYNFYYVCTRSTNHANRR